MIPDVSVIIVSFNTREILRKCLHSLQAELKGVSAEVFVVDNASRDNSSAMVQRDFPDVTLIASDNNLGFAGGNNAALALARGRYVVLLNSDAFLAPQALKKAIAHMDADLTVGLGGARLVGETGCWQPSARLFPSPLNDLLVLSGLSAKFPQSRFFGRFDRTWADPNEPADVDWVPGAFSILRKSVLDQVGHFDERFFLYYEEVDLCRRIKAANHRVRYWPDVVVTHLGGESSKTLTFLEFSSSGAQLALWRIRSAFLYYRKHHGCLVWFSKETERVWHRIRTQINGMKRNRVAQQKAEESRVIVRLLEQAWKETAKGGVSPARPW